MNKRTEDGGGSQKLSVKDKVTLVASAVALLLSIYNFVQQNLLNQHVLKAMVVGVGGQGDDVVSGDVLLINGGKHYETLYDAKFVFAADLSTEKPIIAAGGIGPTVIKPGEALTLKLTGNRPEVVARAVDGAAGQIQVGIRFRAFDKTGDF